ncbi:hypothetical protein KSP40_PGU003623 [Platanthera guangdongensis]|uniref:Uncharacterized protein n=1 Tax=Platanthera guangdongensis TaxID=2320717 RepID=A0ABR2MUH1_9ASPA
MLYSSIEVIFPCLPETTSIYQIETKVLSQNRLNREASAHSLVHLEGYGHYLLHPQTDHQPLEETVGLILQSNPREGEELLQCRGLAVVPMNSAYTILQSTLNPSSTSSIQ